MNFPQLLLSGPLLRALDEERYQSPTPIQAEAIPPALAGRDILGSAQTGTGKTAAFALPILQRLSQTDRTTEAFRCLVLCPTRELASQIADGFATYGRHLKLSHTVIFGGVNQSRQVQVLRRGIDIVIATPGRFLDLMNQGHIDLSHVQTLVLDEADRMLDMGFINDIRKIVAKLPAARQTMLFSATMPAEIRKLADSLLRRPVTIQIAPVEARHELIDQSVYFVERSAKVATLAALYIDLPMARSIVFTRTKHGADRVVRHLGDKGIRAMAIHGNKSQNARERALDSFRNGKIPMLIATDIAARGIDIDHITHVVNYDLTHEPETYLHRIGRTGRAGATGSAISLVDHEEMGNLRAIERLIQTHIPVKTYKPDGAYRPTAMPQQPQSPRPGTTQPQNHPRPQNPRSAKPKRHPNHPTQPVPQSRHQRQQPTRHPATAATTQPARRPNLKGPNRQARHPLASARRRG